MNTQTTRYTATLPTASMDLLKQLAKQRKYPSLNYAINEAIHLYLRDLGSTQYGEAMASAAQDERFLERSATCMEDFRFVDAEGLDKW